MPLAGARRKARPGPDPWRKFTRSRKRWGWKSLGLLLPGLALFGWFLAQPAVALSTGPALLIDNLLRALAVVAAVGAAVFVLAGDGIAERAAVAVSGACLLLGTAVLFSGWGTPFRDWWAMAGALLVTATAATTLLWRRRVWKGIKGLPGKVLISVLTIAAVPLFNFWAETSYLPSRNAASLEVQTKAEVQQAPDGSDHWVITSTLRNLSDVRAFVIISSLTACRWADEAHWRRLPPPDPDYPLAAQCERLAAPFTERSWLDPDATLTISTPARHDGSRPLLQVSLRVAYARADRVIEVLDSERSATSEERGECTKARIVDLQPQSRLIALARRDLALMYAQISPSRGRTYFFGAAGHMRCGPMPDGVGLDEYRFQGLNQYLSLTEATTVWASWPGATPATDAATN